jgi:hypothetical protein
MRLMTAVVLALGAVSLASGCANPSNPNKQSAANSFLIGPVDPRQAAGNAFVGAAVGSLLGAGIGANFFINPLLGAWVGAAAGAGLGAGVGVISTEPAVTYGPIPQRDIAVAPTFYDAWAPGFVAPPVGTQAAPPVPHPG